MRFDKCGHWSWVVWSQNWVLSAAEARPCRRRALGDLAVKVGGTDCEKGGDWVGGVDGVVVVGAGEVVEVVGEEGAGYYCYHHLRHLE